jgi:hypothetical protein
LREEHHFTDIQISGYLGHRTAATIQARYSRVLQPSKRNPQDYSQWLPVGWTLAGASSMSHWTQPAVVGMASRGNAPRSKGRKATASKAGVRSSARARPAPRQPTAAAAAAPPAASSSSSGPKAKKSIAPKAKPLPSAPTRVSARTRVPSSRAADTQVCQLSHSSLTIKNIANNFIAGQVRSRSGFYGTRPLPQEDAIRS